MGEGCTLVAQSTTSLSLIAVGGASDGEGMLAVHKLCDAVTVRPHSGLVRVTTSAAIFSEVTALAFLPAAFAPAGQPVARRLLAVGRGLRF